MIGVMHDANARLIQGKARPSGCDSTIEIIHDAYACLVPN
jgi:hypothetical protein